MIAILLLCKVSVAKAVECDVAELAICAPVFTLSQPPSKACCSKVREQQPCLYEYLKDPLLKPFVDFPYARRAVKACYVPSPKC
ncbi:hypothetical protein RJ639_030986 [Escallonia herrerae]|uniref:Bifunctional inhibitor/plant lipid transfer protein/seed storage helical domain-containing protein n=1 Tax=Escallonia herrerae TaxID=1293975 RepID=A0AA88XDU9_9ASTE|nr:hypothetical protein RJ639_030986 [Escallonia herrerae]